MVMVGRHDHLAVENFGMGLDGAFSLDTIFPFKVLFAPPNRLLASC
jgi:hypothetical protein